eukprot:scaffold1593_cov156-Amphora_coffeaeformis.AAC.4
MAMFVALSMRGNGHCPSSFRGDRSSPVYGNDRCPSSYIVEVYCLLSCYVAMVVAHLNIS